VGVVFKAAGVLDAKASEGIVTSNFVLVSQLHTALGHDVAIILNSVNSELQTVKFGEGTWHEVGIRVLLLS